MVGTREATGEVVELATSGRRLRVTALTALVVALIAGTFFGEDDHFPLGPFRMYAMSNDPNGPVSSIRVRGTVDGISKDAIPFDELGLRRPEIQAQVSRFYRGDLDSLMAQLAASYHRFNPQTRLDRLELFYEIDWLQNGRPVRTEERSIATWANR